MPFRERTVSSNQDIDALKALTGGEASVPFATIGQQQLRGFNDAEWTQYLDLAGYPKQSQLPASYRPAPPSPLVPAQPAPATATAAPDQQEQAPPPATAPAPAPGPSPSNPAGLVFFFFSPSSHRLHGGRTAAQASYTSPLATLRGYLFVTKHRKDGRR